MSSWSHSVVVLQRKRTSGILKVEFKMESTSNSKKMKKLTPATVKRSGLTFPAVRVRRNMIKGMFGKKVHSSAGLFLAAVLEYLTAEILELSGNAARDNKKKLLTPRHVQMAIRHDEELDSLLQDVTISRGGVIPSINPVLLPKKTVKPKAKA